MLPLLCSIQKAGLGVFRCVFNIKGLGGSRCVLNIKVRNEPYAQSVQSCAILPIANDAEPVQSRWDLPPVSRALEGGAGTVLGSGQARDTAQVPGPECLYGHGLL